MQKNYIFFLSFIICFSLQAFDHVAFLAPWQDLIEEAFQEKITYYQTPLHKSKLVVKHLQSENLALDHIRITYYDKKRGKGDYSVAQGKYFNIESIYLQLASSWYWHSLDFKPTFYWRNETKLNKQAKDLEKIIASGKVPKVSIRLSKKTAIRLPYIQTPKVLYTLHLDFGDVDLDENTLLMPKHATNITIDEKA